MTTQELQGCIVCLGLPPLPWTACNKCGALLCEPCKKKLKQQECPNPYCKHNPVRLVTVPFVAQFLAQMPGGMPTAACGNKGCTEEALPLDQLSAHRRTCPMRPIKCHKCQWHGLFGNELAEHLAKVHLFVHYTDPAAVITTMSSGTTRVLFDRKIAFECTGNAESFSCAAIGDCSDDSVVILRVEDISTQDGEYDIESRIFPRKPVQNMNGELRVVTNAVVLPSRLPPGKPMTIRLGVARKRPALERVPSPPSPKRLRQSRSVESDDDDDDDDI